MKRIIAFLIVFLKKVDFPMSQIPQAIMKTCVQLNCIVIGFKVLDGGPTFVGIACCQERGSTVYKKRRTEEAKTKCNGIPCPGKMKSL